MMTTYFYFSVRVLAAVYILYRLWLVLFRKGFYGIWDKIPVKQKKERLTELRPEPVPAPEPYTVVGRTKVEYIKEPVSREIEPVASIPLEPADGDDEEFDEEPDIEHTIVEPEETERPSEEDLEDSDAYIPPPDLDYATGHTYDQLEEALLFMAAPTQDDAVMLRTAATLSGIRHTDMYEFVENELSNTQALDDLFSECLDKNGEVLPKRRSKMSQSELDSFEIDKYV